MVRVTVDSSNIASIGYSDADRILEVEFLNGSIYHYYGVPAHVHAGIMGADSHGKYLNSEIKGTYGYDRLA
ncbi:hypothetical protein GCM10027048_20040 [Hymenobacter coalescens]